MRASLVSGAAPVAVTPTQAAASLDSLGFGLRLTAAVTDGHCRLVARAIPACAIPDLRGRRVAVPAFNDFADHMMRLALAHHGVAGDALTLIPAATQTEAAQALLSGRADIAPLAEPGATATLPRGRAAGQDPHRGVQMRDEMGAITGLRPSLPQASVALRADLADAHPDLAPALVAALSEAAVSLNADPAVAAADAAAFTGRDAGLLAQAIPFSNIHVVAASAARSEMEALFRALIAADPRILAGRLPDAMFYAV